MMQTALPRSWKDEFAIAARATREELRHKERAAHIESQQRDQREKRLADEERNEIETLAMLEMVLASSEEVAAFRVQLDDYDAKTVEALMENREALEAIRRRIDTMLEQAEVLPDGRRVFKTIDGTRVFDEHGLEVASDVVDPQSIDDKKPKWETFKAEKDEEIRLGKEREQLLDYQAKLDAAREKLDKGDITQKDLDGIKADLKADMPDAVRVKVEHGAQKADAGPENSAKAAAIPDNMDQLMRQTGFSAPGPMPG